MSLRSLLHPKGSAVRRAVRQGPRVAVGGVAVGAVALALLAAWPAGALPTSSPTFTALPIDGEPLHGTLAGVESPWTFLLEAEGKDNPARVTARDLYVIAKENSSAGFPGPPSLAREPHVVFANGDFVLARVESTADESVQVRSRMFGELSLPWEAVSALVLRRDDSGRVGGRAASMPTDADVLALTNGDTLSGTILSMDASQIELDSTVGKIEVARSGVASVFFNPELLHLPKPEGLRALVWFADGSRLTATSLGWSDKGLVVETPYSLRARIPPAAIEKMQFLDGRLVYLSDLEPERYEHTPFLSVRWPYERDRSVGGNPLTLGGTVYAKGLGMHGTSRIVYALDGLYDRFEATLGIDDETQGDGSVVFRVLVDGQEVYTSPILRGTDDPIRLEPIKVAGARSLELAIDRADYGDVQDHADWADARLVRD